jgi:dolichyl-phosphate-mannose--protein O-mannosyl transferase
MNKADEERLWIIRTLQERSEAENPEAKNWDTAFLLKLIDAKRGLWKVEQDI